MCPNVALINDYAIRRGHRFLKSIAWERLTQSYTQSWRTLPAILAKKFSCVSSGGYERQIDMD